MSNIPTSISPQEESIMSSTEIVQTFITALQSGDFELAAKCMADDFVLSGWAPQPLDKGVFLAMQSELHNAMPDYSFHLSNLEESHIRSRRSFKSAVRIEMTCRYPSSVSSLSHTLALLLI